MKTTVIYLMATVAFAAAAELVHPLASRSISSTAESAILDIRDQMPCGFPQFGIPPLAPFVVDHKDINIDTPDINLVGTVDQFQLSGLNDFDIEEIKVNVLTKKVNLSLFFRNINVDTLYDLKLYLKKAGFTINLIGAGHAKFAIKDLKISALLKYSFGLISQKLKLKSIDAGVQIGDVDSDIEGLLGDGAVNHKMNDILEEAVATIVNNNNEFISKAIENKIFPPINAVLNNYKLNDLIGLIGKGSDNESESVCEPSNPQ